MDEHTYRVRDATVRQRTDSGNTLIPHAVTDPLILAEPARLDMPVHWQGSDWEIAHVDEGAKVVDLIRNE